MREQAGSGIVVIGELNVDAVATGLAQEPKLGLEIIAEDFQMTLGSASAIFACGVAKLGHGVTFVSKVGREAPPGTFAWGGGKLGHGVTFVSKVGRDDFGDLCLEALRGAGVETRHVR